MNWSEQVVLVTGGTGSFGRKFVEVMLREYRPKKLVVFSRDAQTGKLTPTGIDMKLSQPVCIQYYPSR